MQYKDALEFHPEYQLNDQPLIMDVLVAKKAKDVAIEKNIGAIFKTENVIEYKSPADKIAVGDFYKVYGYACFHASQKQVDIREATLTLVETRYPKKLIKHLREERGTRWRSGRRASTGWLGTSCRYRSSRARS
jgi:hypothetical protein